jgi:pimeloyl-ACP methyl ester carboxylesterase
LRAEALQAARSSRWNGKRGRVVLIPGFLSSELTEFGPNGSQAVVWLNLFRLAFGRMESLRLAPDGTDGQVEVRATGILKKWYAEAILRLSQDWDVRVFWYDWRKDLNLAADSLAQSLQEWFGAEPVCHLIGHDMGGLVARTFIKNHPDLWEKMWDRESEIAGAGGGRLVALGAPHCGSLTAPQLLTGTHDFIIKLGMVDLKHTAEEVRAIWATFPALYQMLPSPFALPAFEPLYDARSYGDIAVSQPHLNAARSFHERLRGLVDPWRMTSVLGTESLDRPGNTRSGLLARARLSKVVTRALDADPHAANQLGQLRTLEGQPVPTYYAAASSGNLLATPAVLDELGDLLETGICLGLPTSQE